VGAVTKVISKRPLAVLIDDGVSIRWEGFHIRVTKTTISLDSLLGVERLRKAAMKVLDALMPQHVVLIRASKVRMFSEDPRIDHGPGDLFSTRFERP
jgi:hypothetical protein